MNSFEKNTLETLRRLEGESLRLSRTMHQEQRIYAAELEERQRLGLHGAEAVEHYNKWMADHGLQHQMVKS